LSLPSIEFISDPDYSKANKALITPKKETFVRKARLVWLVPGVFPLPGVDEGEPEGELEGATGMTLHRTVTSHCAVCSNLDTLIVVLNVLSLPKVA
jgi:hypothetical protein